MGIFGFTALFLLGLCLGSFVNALVWRLHQQTLASQKDKNLSIVHGRSMCTDCKHILAWYDLVPILSWLSLGGKCRYCHKSISWQYPLVELLTAGLFVFSYLFWPEPIQDFQLLVFGFWLLFLVGFMALAIYDLRWMLLPDKITFPLQALAIVNLLVLAYVSPNGWQVLEGRVLGVLCSAGLFYLIYQLSGGKWIGGGDVKLAVVLGLLVGGPAQTLLMLFIASCLGSLVGLPLLIMGKAKQTTKLPFGPLLIIATIMVYLFGSGFIAWYKQLFLLA